MVASNNRASVRLFVALSHATPTDTMVAFDIAAGEGN